MVQSTLYYKRRFTTHPPHSTPHEHGNTARIFFCLSFCWLRKHLCLCGHKLEARYTSCLLFEPVRCGMSRRRKGKSPSSKVFFLIGNLLTFVPRMRYFGNLLTCVFCEIMRFPAQQNLRQCKMTSLFQPSSRLEGYLLYLQFFSDGDVRGVQFPLSHVVFLSYHGLKNSQTCHHNCPCLHHLGTC